ncbi:MAG TPA: RNA polymerase sigma factor [Solirubrobacteraceae bacterium]|nr:RNA polymerase sigma factor [Solirubrobacteraceae bacterium]
MAVPFSALRDDAIRESGPPEAAQLSDAQLVALARESHSQAFELVYAAYKGRVYTFLLRLTADADLADDLTQDVFTKAFRSLATFTTDHKILPWLYRVATNAAIDTIRRRRRFVWLRLGKITGTSVEPTVSDAQAELPQREHVQAVLRTLPPENAGALLLHALEGYSYKEIAEIQGCSMTAVRSRIARARAAFRQAYDGG